MTTATETFYQKNCESFLYSSANSLFTDRDSIWTYNCPCPSPRHRTDSRHICRFKEHAASSVISDHSVNHLLQEEFESLVSSFRQRSVPVIVSSSSSATVVATEPKYTTYAEFMDLMAEEQMVVRARQCYYVDGCHTKDCTFGHSIEEMVDLFKDRRVSQFYREATLKRTVYMLSTKNTEMTLNTMPKPTCPYGKCKKNDTPLTLRLILYTGYDSYLITPYMMLKCPNCLRTQNVPIYK